MAETTVTTNPTSLTTGGVLPPLGKATVTPSLTTPPSDPAQMQAFLNAVKEIIEVYDGKRGNAYDSVVTWRELFEHGVVDLKIDGNIYKAKPVTPNIFPSNSNSDFTVPPAPENLTASAGFTSAILAWNAPVFTSFAYAEIWRSDTNSIGSAAKIGTTTARVYADSVAFTNTTKYYWVRFVNQNDVVGPYNSATGVSASTSKVGNADLYDLIIDAGKLATDAVESGKIKDYAITTTKIANLAVGNAAIANGAITNAKIENAAIDNAKIANLDAAKITTGYISADRLDASTITAKVLSVDWAKLTNVYITWGQIQNVYITDAQIQSLQAAKITGLDAQLSNVTASKINVVATTAGATTGARMTINNDVIKVFDSSNVLRVKIGNLDA